MANPVVQDGICNCSMGDCPCALNFLPTHNLNICGLPAAAITDFVPLLNIMTFGMCNSIANPEVAAATAAADGVLTPMPCVPSIVSPWIIGNPKILLNTGPILTSDSKQVCVWGGAISIDFAGQVICNSK